MTDEKTILLNEDQQELVQRTLRDLSYDLKTLSLGLRNTQSVNTELALNILRSSDYYLATLGKILGISSQTGQEVDERSVSLRAAYERIRYLEKQLGSSQTPAATQASLKQMCERMNAWWNLEGFGHISHIRFGESGCEVFFACHPNRGFSSSRSNSPISHIQHKKEWLDRGYMLTTSEHGDASLVDSDHNRQLLSQLFASRLPSSQITSFLNQSAHHEILLRTVKVYVSAIEEMLSLPIALTSESVTKPIQAS